jgi:hypothetical protein
MASKTKTDEPSREGNQDFDDLTVVKGIGEALEQWLRESFQIHTFADLAALPAEEFESHARDAGRILSRSKIEQIIAQAKDLAGGSKQAAPESGGKPVKTKAVTKPILPVNENNWEQFATFVVEFERKVVDGKEEKRTTAKGRTTAHEMEGWGNQRNWPGIETDEVCHWILERLGEREEVAPQEAPVAAVEVAQPALESSTPQSVALEITGIQVIQNMRPQDLYVQGRAFSNLVKGADPEVSPQTRQPYQPVKQFVWGREPAGGCMISRVDNPNQPKEVPPCRPNKC